MKKNHSQITVLSLVLLFAPGQALAAKASDSMGTPTKPMVVEPGSVQKVPSTKVVKPIVDINQTRSAATGPMCCT